MSEDSEILAAREAMIAKRFGGVKAQTGGKGSVRRSHKASVKSSGGDVDRKLQTALKKMGATAIPGIEEVNLFKDDGNVVHFVNPKVQASVASNTYIVSGNAETKSLQELLPGIVNQLGPEAFKQLQESFAAASNTTTSNDDEDSDDDDVPELVEGSDFQSTSNA
jgi:nascent polypeptide-associated complex subunit beta